MMKLKCWCCGQEKTLHEFRRDRSRAFGFRACLACQKVLELPPMPMRSCGRGAIGWRWFRDRATGLSFRAMNGESVTNALRVARQKWRERKGRQGAGWSNP